MLEINGWFMEQYEEDNSTKTNNPISGYIFSVAYKIMVRKGKKNKKKKHKNRKNKSTICEPHSLRILWKPVTKTTSDTSTNIIKTLTKH